MIFRPDPPSPPDLLPSRALTNEFLLLIVCSPSGAGKTTLTKKTMDYFQDLTFSVSHTTRPAREGERDGVDYHFVSRNTFESMVEQDSFVEWAEVHGNLYGTALSEIERAQKSALCTGMLFDVDHQGARQIRARVPDVVGVFILPPSMRELERRLRGRNTETTDVISRRFVASKDEIEHYALFDYLVINEHVDSAFENLKAIILAERSRRKRRAYLAESLLRLGKIE